MYLQHGVSGGISVTHQGLQAFPDPHHRCLQPRQLCACTGHSLAEHGREDPNHDPNSSALLPQTRLLMRSFEMLSSISSVDSEAIVHTSSLQAEGKEMADPLRMNLIHRGYKVQQEAVM